MSIITGQVVPKVRRTNDEVAANSGSRAAASDGVAGRIRFGRHVLDLDRGCLLADEDEVALRPKSFELLRHLARNAGRLVSKDELLAAVWPNVIVTEDSLVQCVAELRRALGDHDQRLIRTVPRRGYRLDAALRFEPSAAPPVAAGRPPRPVARQALGALALLLATIGALWWPGSRPNPAPPLSIVVLPFASLSDDPDQQYFADGVSSELTTELSRLPGLFVIAHATARTFEGKVVDARQVGRELKVRYLLDGSIRRIGDQIRLNVQLVDTASGASVWGKRFERRSDQLAAWQDEVIGRIAVALSLHLTRLEGARALRARGDDPAAGDLTTRGWALVYTAKRPETYAAARALFQQALERAPGTVNAQVGLGWTAAVAVLDGWSAAPADDLAAAEAAVARALALDPDHFVAHHVRGFTLRLRRRSQSAYDAFGTAVALNPNFASGHAQLGVTALELGRPEETVPAIERAVALSPRDPNLGPWLAIAGMAELHLGRPAAAAAWLRRAIDTGTPVALHQAYLASALALAGRMAEAQAALTEFRRARPAATIARLRTQAWSTEPGFVAQREPLYAGLRVAGLN
jgi:adenylate cyclase